MAKAKRRKPTSNISRAFRLCEAQGWLPGIVERRCTPVLKVDLFGFADILVVNRPRPLLIQACETSSRYAHLATMAAVAGNVQKCMRSNIDVELWTWARRKRNGREVWVHGRVATMLDASAIRGVGMLVVEWRDMNGFTELETIRAPLKVRAKKARRGGANTSNARNST